MPSHLEAAIADRRLLLRHALQDYKDRGGQVSFPVGCDGFEDWLLDSLDASTVLNQINKRGNLELISMCSSTETLQHSILSRLPDESNGDGTSNGRNGSDFNDINRRRALPHLQLKAMAINMDERDLELLAFQIFAASCGSRASQGLLQNIRAHLEIGEAVGKDLAGVVQLAQKNGISSLTTIDALVKLLQVVQPSMFSSFRSFVAWRQSISSAVSKSFEHAAAHSWSTKGSDGAAAGGAPARSLLAALRGSLRRLDVREADDYEESEYAAAARGVAEAAGRLAANLQSSLTLPMGLSVQVAELLLGGVFDPLDEGQFADESTELLALLSANLWPQLGISPQMNSALAMWVHFRQYMASKEVSLLKAGANLAHQLGGAAHRNANTSDSDSAFTLKVLDAMSSEASAALSDYHASFDSISEMQAVLEFLGAIESVRGNDGTLGSLLTECIKGSVGAAFARRVTEVHNQVALEEDRTALLATETAALLHTERSKFTPVLRKYQPAAAAIAAATLHEVYGAKMLSWLIQVNNLTKSVAATIHASVDLEAELMAEIQANGNGVVTQPAAWGAMQRVTPLLHTWAQSQVTNMHGWLDRILKEENWEPVVQQRGAASRSAVEVIKAMDDAVHTLFGMDLPIPASVVNVLVEGIDTILQRYCKRAVADIGSADSLVPPAPPLTRYKKDLADAAEQEAMGGASTLKHVTSKVNAALSSSWLPALTADEQQRIMNTLYDTLVVRANSMHYVATSVSGLEGLIVQKWEEAQEKELSSDGGALQSGVLNGSVATAADTCDQILRFMTLKLICGDLRSAIFKDLYAYRAEYATLGTVLQEVDGALGMLCEMLNESLAPRIAGHMCKALAAAVQHVLLDGGPNRLFTVQDVPLLFDDFEHLKEMFYAEGAGLDPAAVSRLCAPLEEALQTMAASTPDLISTLKSSKKTPLKAGANSQNGGYDPEIALHVLCHRADYEASKYLKSNHKIAKKLPNVFSASVSRSFAAVFPAGGKKAATPAR